MSEKLIVVEEKTEPKITVFKTSDLYFSAYLISSGFSMMTTERQEMPDGKRPKVVFLFKIDETILSGMKRTFFGGTGTVKVRLYVDALRNLKAMCHV